MMLTWLLKHHAVLIRLDSERCQDLKQAAIMATV